MNVYRSIVHVVIMGCGRVGTELAQTLDAAGHSVSVIDQIAKAFSSLGEGFKGQTVTGIGFDRDRLREAGIERADAFAAVSSGDNSNILAARVARETFGVDTVVARIYDPRRAEVYQRLGIPTVASVPWQTDQILRRILPGHNADEWSDASGLITLAQLPVSTHWVGERYTRLERESGARIAFITRLGKGMLTNVDSVIQDGDSAHVVLTDASREQATTVLAQGPEVN
jgi:trk system potassium uptake protein TrkA